DSQRVYFIWPAGFAEAAVYSVDRSARCGTGSPVVGSPNAFNLVLDADHVFWTNGSGQIAGSCKSGGPATSLAAGLGPLSGDIAIDGTFVYWTTNEVSGRVMRIAK